MRAIAVTPKKAGSAKQVELPKPEAARGLALMRVLEVGIDGTDTEINNGEYGEAPPGADVLVIGHEALSIVEKATFQAWKMQERMLWQPKRAVVLGAGPIGILCTILLRLRGLEVHVYAKSAPDSQQGRILADLDAVYESVDDHPVMRIKDELGQVDFILEATGNSTVAFQAMAQVGTNGVICLTGVSAGN